jgi:nucleoside-triphosphatase THEP1
MGQGMDEIRLAEFEQAYKNLDLVPLITPEDIAAFRVDYGLEVLVRLKREIEASAKNAKLVFTGHRGCGKSTLLKRLEVEMQAKHFVVRFSIADMIEMSGVTHVNILYAIALMLLSHATKRQVPVPEDIRETLLGWTNTVHRQKSEQATKSELGAGIDKMLNLVTAKLQQEKTFRDELEKTFEKRVSDLVAKSDRLAAAILTTTQKPVLVIIDDIDKLDLGLAESIYRKSIRSLFSPQFRILFTIPVAAVQEPQIMGALSSEDIVRPYILPVAKFFAKQDCHKPNAEPITHTLNTFLELLNKRIPADLMEPETARRMVLLSGGVLRELVRIARECCTECMVRLEIEPERSDIRINDEILAVALRNLRNDFARQLGSSLYAVLVEVYQNHKPLDISSSDFVKLLHGLMVLEYQNDALWYDVHPIVVDLLQREKRVPAE